MATRFLHISILLFFLGLALLFPYVWFGVTPYRTDEVPTTEEIETLKQGSINIDWYAQELPEISEERSSQLEESYGWCRFCHTVNEGGEHRVGPNLHRIYGQPIAVVPNFPYSNAFLEFQKPGVVWTPALMKAFASDPHTMVPGNRMRYPPMFFYEMSEERDEMIVEYLLRNTR
jgi:cytochrome c2